ncbi:MAG TPA: cation diffusion facilitator family transporter [archaeon]|nr:cation diffusion facilitator family transporter [archaeon]
MRYKQIIRVQVIVLVLNVLVAMAKIIYGTITGSISMEADGFHSLMDGGGTLVGMLGIYMASRPPDESHPYGHGKLEQMAALIIAGLLLITGFEVAEGAINRFLEQTSPQVTQLSFAIMLATMAINLAVTTYENRKGKELNSEILVADSLHTRSDIFVSLGVIVSLIAVSAGYFVIDVIGGIIIALLIVRAGYKIVKHTSNSLIDASILDTDILCQLALEMEGVEDCHNIRTRGTADMIYVDLHIKVKKDMHIDEAHDIAHNVESHIKSRMKGVRDVVVHLEPYKEKK